MAPLEGAWSAGGAPAPRWGMVIDLNRCVGCQTCTIACKQANDTLPGVQWRRVLDVELGVYPDVERLFLPVGCQHCDRPTCVPVCPTGATYRRPDGIVAIDYDLCIGCASCAVACPYEARYLAHRRNLYYRDRDTAQEQAVVHEERLGVAQKCTFCVGKLDAGRALGLAPGRDMAATPVCASSCIAQAIAFGDFNDPADPIARMARDQASFAMHEELGARPMIRYLYRTPAVPGRDAEPGDMADERLADPENPLVGKLQRHWDARAAMNFVCGGIGSGLAVAAYFAHVFAGLPSVRLPGLYAAAAALLAVGLFSVFLKIGRKLRFAYALRRPRTSWMAREVYVVLVFYPLVAADCLWPRPELHALTATAAFAFLFCQARILHACKGIPAWRAQLMPWMLVATGLLEGLGALLLALVAIGASVSPVLAAAAIGLATGNAALWHAYRTGAKTAGIPPLARMAIDRTTPWLHLIGHAVPIAGCAAALTIPSLAPEMLAAAGLGAVVGGALWKFRVITGAAYHQGFALPKLPRRGSGRRSAWADAPATGA